MKPSTVSGLKRAALMTFALTMVGCSSLNPVPLEDKAVRERAAADRVRMFDEQEPITAAITLEEAVAIVNLLGSLPTAQGAHPLWAKLKAQVEPLLPKPEEVKQ